MNRMHLLTAAALALPLFACDSAGETPQEVTAEELVAALPTSSMLVVPYPGMESAARPGVEAQLEAEATCQAAQDDATAIFYRQGCHVLSYINGTVNDVLRLLEQVTSHPPTHTGENAYAWGPYDNGEGQTLVFAMKQNDDGTISYQMDAKQTGASDSSALVILHGKIEAGVSATRNVGNFQLSYDNIHAVDPDRAVAGVAAYRYDRLGTQTGVEARVDQVLGGDGERHDFAVDYNLNDDRSGDIRYGYTDDIVQPEGSSSQEVQKVKTRWLSTGAGRSDATLSGGDLGEETAYMSECWDSSYVSVFANASWWESSEGDAAQCVFESAEFPSF